MAYYRQQEVMLTLYALAYKWRAHLELCHSPKSNSTRRKWIHMEVLLLTRSCETLVCRAICTFKTNGHTVIALT